MKCDVCGTKIPIGSHECPNCGYKWRDTHINTFDTLSKSHDHIQVKNQAKQTTSFHGSSKKSQLELPKWFYIAVFIIVIAMILSIAIPSMLSHFDTSHNENLSFEELITEGYDEDGLIAKAQDEEAKIAYLFKNDFKLQNIDTIETSYPESYGVSTFSFEVSGRRNDTTYGVRYEYNEGELTQKEFYTIGDTQISLHSQADLLINIKTLQSLGSHIGIQDTIGVFNQARHSMKEDNSDSSSGRVFSFKDQIDGVDIYLTEEPKIDTTTTRQYYHYYCSMYIQH